jgi:threonine aldolase
MLESVLTAKTGDDVMGEDPTVRQLESYVAHTLFDKPAALFVPTGTMANLLAILAHCHTRASEIIIGSQSHICLWEGGNYASLGNVSTRQLLEDTATAEFQEGDILDACRQDNDDHFAQTKLLCLENTHNMLGGLPLSKDYMDRMGSLCRDKQIALHVDGARIFNASIALQIPVKDLCQAADSISVCLSKGLGAPLGSVLVGDAEFIRLAKRARKRCGGGMRQAGVVAAMGLYALQNNVELLKDDHRRAKRLAEELARHGFQLAHKVDTNIVFFALPDNSTVLKEDFGRKLAEQYNIKLTGGYSQGGKLFRVVTHLDLSDEDIDRALEAMASICR